MQASNFRVSIALEGHISPSEDPGKVMKALQNVLGDCQYETEQTSKSITMRSKTLKCVEKMRDQFRDRRIRGVARKLAMGSRTEYRLTFMLNRQSAYEGIVALCSSEEESPMGPLYLTIESPDLDKLIEWLTSYPEAG
jgi:predicted RNA binding protein with dsRBD fold (UPF0201 family)